MSRKATNQDARLRQTEGLAKRMRREATDRTCPECGRKYALTRQALPDERLVITVCRWCKYERGVET